MANTNRWFNDPTEIIKFQFSPLCHQLEETRRARIDLSELNRPRKGLTECSKEVTQSGHHAAEQPK